MRLIGIARVVHDGCPSPLGISISCRERGFKAQRSSVEFGRDADFCDEPALELTQTQARPVSDGIDPRAASRRDQQSGCMVKAALTAASQGAPLDPLLRRYHPSMKTFGVPDRVFQAGSCMPQYVSYRDALISQGGHGHPEQAMESGRLEADRKNVDVAAHVQSEAGTRLRPDYRRFRSKRRWAVVNADPVAFAEVEFDELVGPGRQGSRDAHPRERDATLSKRTDEATDCGMSRLAKNFHSCDCEALGQRCKQSAGTAARQGDGTMIKPVNHRYWPISDWQLSGQNYEKRTSVRRASSNFLIIERIRKGGAAIPGFGIGADRPFGVIPGCEADGFNYSLPVVFEAQC